MYLLTIVFIIINVSKQTPYFLKHFLHFNLKSIKITV